jgi:hypothetical protein
MLIFSGQDDLDRVSGLIVLWRSADVFSPKLDGDIRWLTSIDLFGTPR